jgi:hypothetical protein
MPLFFQKFYSLVPKIEICLKYFLDKTSQKQPLCKSRTFLMQIHSWDQYDIIDVKILEFLWTLNLSRGYLSSFRSTDVTTYKRIFQNSALFFTNTITAWKFQLVCFPVIFGKNCSKILSYCHTPPVHWKELQY